MSTVTSRPALGSKRLPPAWRIALSRGRLEIKVFFRERDAVVFGFALPIVFVALFGAIFGNEPIGHGYTYVQVLVPSMLVMGVASSSLVNLGIWITSDREDGTLRRLYLSPMPRMAYFVGKIIMMVVVGALETVLLVGVGVLAYGVELPPTGEKWLIGIGMMLLSFAVFGVLGVAVSSLPRSARSAPAVINFPVLVLYFVSGVFLPYNQLPGWLQQIGAVFPLKWMVQGFQSAFLPDDLALSWPTHEWEHGRIVLVLLAWLVIGLVICLTTFRWKDRRHG
ncbi:MAG TPA: ABC transporter permease [Actinopolymorphaceae bacterium]